VLNVVNKVIVTGALGRMGQQVVAAVEQEPSLELVAALSKNDDLSAAIEQHQAQIVIDFTVPAAVFQNMQIILAGGSHPVVGTTGLSHAQITELAQQCERLKRGAIIAPNFSIGAVLMMKCAAEIARHFSEVEIIELHHEKKIDAPSGTAIKTAEMIAKQLPSPAKILQSEVNVKNARGELHFNIPIHSVRLPGLVAHQQVIFGSPGETVTLRHDAIDRSCFMPGVIFACKKVVTLNKLIYGLEQLL